MDTLSRHLLPRSRYTALLLCCALSLQVLTAGLIWQTFQLHVAASDATLRIDQLQAAQAKRPVPKLSLSERELEKRWATLNAERDFSWKPLFSAIERTVSPEIELLEFDPDKASRQLTLSGEAKNQQALVTFLDALAQQPCFKNVHLTHQQKKTRERLETVSFELKAAIAL